MSCTAAATSSGASLMEQTDEEEDDENHVSKKPPIPVATNVETVPSEHITVETAVLILGFSERSRLKILGATSWQEEKIFL